MVALLVFRNSHPPCCHLRTVTHASSVSPAQASCSLAKVFSPPLIHPPPGWGSPEKKGGETERLREASAKDDETLRGDRVGSWRPQREETDIALHRASFLHGSRV